MKRVLVIDPSPEVAEQMMARLQLDGWEVAVENEGIAGLETIKRFHPDLLYIDSEVESINGYQLCRLVKDSAEGRTLPIVITSWDSGENARFWAQESGADAFLAKPYAPNELIKIADSLISSGE